MPGFVVRHPSPRRLRAFGLGRIAERRLSRISAHLIRCPRCRDWLEGDATRVHRRDDLLIGLRDVGDDACSPPITSSRWVRQTASARALLPIRRAPPPSPPPRPKRIADYDLLTEAGRGGMGIVHRAWDRKRSRFVAIKTPILGNQAPANIRRQLKREAELASMADHPHLLAVYEAETDGPWPFLAMEWADGGSLDDQIGESPWPRSRAVPLVRSLCRALGELHRQGVIHCDLKPSNILMRIAPATSEQRLVPKIADFGLALALSVPHSHSHSHSHSRSPARTAPALTIGRMGGTPEYMAPEQALGDGRRIGPATDIFAMGAILHQLLTGRLPFRGPLQPRRTIGLEAIVFKAVAPDLEARYPSAMAFADALRPFADE